MNLQGKNIDELAQMRADQQNLLLKLNGELETLGKSLQEIKLEGLEIEKKRTESAWTLKLKRREYNDAKIQLDMIENAFWSQKRRQ